MAVGCDPKIPFWDGLIDKVLYKLCQIGVPLGRYSSTNLQDGKQETTDFAMGDAVATVGIRSDGSMWVSVQSNSGPHFQCDFIGEIINGPTSEYDFNCDPPVWVINALKENK
jgi:hypothetical protein